MRALERGVNKLYDNKILRRRAWEWLKSGMSLREVREALIAQGTKYALSTISAFKDLMIQETGEEIQEDDYEIDVEKAISSIGTPVSRRGGKSASKGKNVQEKIKDVFGLDGLVTNDAQVIDVLISKGFQSMLSGNFEITPQTVMKALELKKAMLGKEYSGQTAWSVQDLQSKLTLLLNVVNKHTDSSTWERIMRDLEEAGWDDGIMSGVGDTSAETHGGTVFEKHSSAGGDESWSVESVLSGIGDV